VNDPELDLLMIPGDGTFLPYTGPDASESEDNVTSPTNGRIFALKFASSSQRHLFWMQSKSQHPEGHANWFSPRDKKLGQIVDSMLQGDTDIDVREELQNVDQGGSGGGDDDQQMEDAEQPEARHDRSDSTGGAGSGATGGDVREEGEEAREGGADGGRA